MESGKVINLINDAVDAYNNSNLDIAKKLLEQLIQIITEEDIVYSKAKIYLAKIYYETGDYFQAIKMYKTLSKIDAENYIKAQFNLGRIFYETNYLEEALECFLEITHEYPNYFFYAQINLGIIYINKGQNDKAIEVLSKLEKRDDIEYANAQWNLGVLYGQKEMWDRACAAYLQISDAHEALYDRAQINLSYALKRTGNLKAAIEICQNFNDNKNDEYAAAKLNLGSYLVEIEAREQAITEYFKVPEEKLDTYAAAMLYAAIQYEKLGEEKLSVETYKLVPKDSGSSYAWAQWNLAQIYLERKEYQNFIELIKKFKFVNNIKDFEFRYLHSIYEKIVSLENSFLFLDLLQVVENILDILYVSLKEEKFVAHYTSLVVAKMLLPKDDNITNSSLRLNTIQLMNDPEEGFQIDKVLCLDDNVIINSHAFVSCFTLHHDSLNQFRLYGKDNQREATGISLILDRSFFADDSNISKIIKIEKILNIEVPDATCTFELQEEKQNLWQLPLYRCIYLDPTSGLIKVAQREEWSFHREFKKESKESILDSNPEAEKKWKEYQTQILQIELEVNAHLKKLVEQVKQLYSHNLSDDEKELLAEILLPLRYLIKHMAFKEEQECRMIYVTHMDNPLIKYDEKINRIYIDYEPSVMEHLEKIYLAPKAKDEKMVFEYLCSRGQEVRKGKPPVKVKISQNPFR